MGLACIWNLQLCGINFNWGHSVLKYIHKIDIWGIIGSYLHLSNPLLRSWYVYGTLGKSACRWVDLRDLQRQILGGIDRLRSSSRLITWEVPVTWSSRRLSNQQPPSAGHNLGFDVFQVRNIDATFWACGKPQHASIGWYCPWSKPKRAEWSYRIRDFGFVKLTKISPLAAYGK